MPRVEHNSDKHQNQTRKNDHFGQQHCCAANRAESGHRGPGMWAADQEGPSEAEDTVHPMTQVPRGLLWAVCLRPNEHHSSSTTNGLLFPLSDSFSELLEDRLQTAERAPFTFGESGPPGLLQPNLSNLVSVFAVNCVRLPGHKHGDLQNSPQVTCGTSSSPPGQPGTPPDRTPPARPGTGRLRQWAHLCRWPGCRSAPHTSGGA